MSLLPAYKLLHKWQLEKTQVSQVWFTDHWLKKFLIRFLSFILGYSWTDTVVLFKAVVQELPVYQIVMLWNHLFSGQMKFSANIMQYTILKKHIHI